LKYNLIVYKRSFRASQGVDALMKQFDHCSREQAADFARVLQKHHILDHVVRDHDFNDTDGLFFRLQCYQTPNILNSYRIWTEYVDPDSLGLIKRLKNMLTKILSNHMDPAGKVDYMEAAMDKDFPAFEEAVCELQGVRLMRMPLDTKLVRDYVVRMGMVVCSTEKKIAVG
jgi:hypothetical protein